MVAARAPACASTFGCVFAAACGVSAVVFLLITSKPGWQANTAASISISDAQQKQGSADRISSTARQALQVTAEQLTQVFDPCQAALTEAQRRGAWVFNTATYKDLLSGHPGHVAQQPVTVLSSDHPAVLLLPNFTVNFDPSSEGAVDELMCRLHQVIGVPMDFGESPSKVKYSAKAVPTMQYDFCVEHSGRAMSQACLDFLLDANGPGCGPWQGGETCGDRLLTALLVLSASPTASIAFPLRRLDNSDPAFALHNLPHPMDACSRAPVLRAPVRPGDLLLIWHYYPLESDGYMEEPVQAYGSVLDGTRISQLQPDPWALYVACAGLREHQQGTASSAWQGTSMDKHQHAKAGAVGARGSPVADLELLVRKVRSTVPVPPSIKRPSV